MTLNAVVTPTSVVGLTLMVSSPRSSVEGERGISRKVDHRARYSR